MKSIELKKRRKILWLTGTDLGVMGNGMNKILEGLYVGNLGDSRSSEQLQENGITHIVSIYDAAKPIVEGMKYLCIQADDIPSQDLTIYFGECLEFIHRARADRGSVLVHCLAGVSRSVTITTAYILMVTKLTWRDALNAVRGARHCANPNFGFQKQLQDWSCHQLPLWRERCKQWPTVAHDDVKRCVELLALHKHWVHNGNDSSNTYPLAENAYKPKYENDSPITERYQKPYVNSTTHNGHSTTLPPAVKKESKTSDRLRSAIRNTLNARSKKSSTSMENHTANEIPTNGSAPHHQETTQDAPPVTTRKARKKSLTMSLFRRSKPKIEDEMKSDVPDAITRSMSLPTPNRQLHRSTPDIYTTEGQITPRLLRGYQDQFPVTTTNQSRIHLSQAPPRPRNYGYVQSSDVLKRVTDPAIPERLERRLTRSKSVGILSMHQLRMHKTEEASVIAIDECEDWEV